MKEVQREVSPQARTSRGALFTCVVIGIIALVLLLVVIVVLVAFAEASPVLPFIYSAF